MKKLMFLISTEGKSKEQIKKESAEAFRKYREVESKMRVKLILNSMVSKFRSVLHNNLLTQYLERRKQKDWSERLAKQLGENLNRNLEAQKNDPNYEPPL